MKLDEAIRLSLLAYVKRNHDPDAHVVTGYTEQVYVGGNRYTRIFYAHKQPMRDIRSILYYETISVMFDNINLDLTEES